MTDVLHSAPANVGVTLAEGAIQGFKANFRGSLLDPSDPEYEQVRRVWNGMIDRRPALIAAALAPPMSSPPSTLRVNTN